MLKDLLSELDGLIRRKMELTRQRGGGELPPSEIWTLDKRHPRARQVSSRTEVNCENADEPGSMCDAQ